MATKKKLLQAAAGNAGGAVLDVEGVFSTYLYDGNGSTQTITNGIDLSGEGGLVWFKNRQTADIHALFDSERPLTDYLRTNGTNAASSATTNLAFNSNGFSFNNNIGFCNTSSQNYTSWTFLKSKRFFDCVTFSGTGSVQNISHNLGATVGSIFVKCTSTGYDWQVYHRGLDGSAPEDYRLNLNNTTARADNASIWNDTAPTSTEFTVGTNANVNQSGQTYVAYLFAHNNGDGEFGPDGDADIIKCGSYTGNGSATGPSVNLGFEPQWLLIRNADRADDWVIIDSMRGIPSSSDGPAVLRPESSAAEYASGSGFSQASRVDLTATGFDVKSSNSRVNGSSQNMIYIAIRRPTAVPTSATEVFAIDTWSSGEPNWTSGFPVDFSMVKGTASSAWEQLDRLRGEKGLNSHSTAAEASQTWTAFDNQNGFGNLGADSTYYSWMWKRAPSYMDCVAYFGNSTAGRTVSHNLGVAPEMMWVKQRPYSSDWRVYHSALGNTKVLVLNSDAASATLTSAWNSTTPTSSVFTLGSLNDVNESPLAHIAYLFATLAGISKVGSYTGTGGTAQTIDCGFSSGARMVIIKCSSHNGQWYIFDVDRGITTTVNDGVLMLNLPNAQSPESSAFGSAIDAIQPDNSGFKVQYSDLNESGRTFIFYAIA